MDDQRNRQADANDVGDDRSDGIRECDRSATHPVQRHNHPIHEAVDDQCISHTGNPRMVNQSGKPFAGGIEDSGRDEGNQEVDGETERAGGPPLAECRWPQQAAGMPCNKRPGETPFGTQVKRAAVMSMTPQRSPAATIAGNAREIARRSVRLVSTL
jgi:hypothetical protein